MPKTTQQHVKPWDLTPKRWNVWEERERESERKREILRGWWWGWMNKWMSWRSQTNVVSEVKGLKGLGCYLLCMIWYVMRWGRILIYKERYRERKLKFIGKSSHETRLGFWYSCGSLCFSFYFIFYFNSNHFLDIMILH